MIRILYVKTVQFLKYKYNQLYIEIAIGKTKNYMCIRINIQENFLRFQRINDIPLGL